MEFEFARNMQASKWYHESATEDVALFFFFNGYLFTQQVLFIGSKVDAAFL